MIKFQSKFSHIYIEKQVENLSLSKLIISKFNHSKIIKIDHYKDIFNRVRQDFQVQKKAMNLILARKTEPLLYPASDMVQDYKNPNSLNQNVLIGVFLIHSIIFRTLNGMSPKSLSFSRDTNKTSSLLSGKLITITLSL